MRYIYSILLVLLPITAKAAAPGIGAYSEIGGLANKSVSTYENEATLKKEDKGKVSGIRAISNKSTINVKGANEYFWATDGRVFECDDDLGNVGNKIFLYYTDPIDQDSIKAKQCIIEWNGDYFADKSVNWCSNDRDYSYKCNGKTIKLNESKYICVDADVNTVIIGKTGFSDGKNVGCKFHAPTAQPQKSTTQQSMTQNSGIVSEQTQLSPTSPAPTAPQPKTGDNCPDDKLPQYATTGKYINYGGKLKCTATTCQSGTYLVVNSTGTSQGWCVASSYCKNDTKLNIINNTQTDLKCIQNVSKSTETENENSQDSTQTENDNPPNQDTASDQPPSVQNPDTDKQEQTSTPENDNNQSSDGTIRTDTSVKPAELVDGDKCTSTDMNATAGIVRGGMCVPALCRDGYELSDNRCIEIGGECDDMPQNAIAAHRKYNFTTKEIECMVDSCEKNYKKSDDKLSCVQDLNAALQSSKDKAQSLTARLTSGAAIGAMGIGGMQALSAVAEQNADADAERDMQAYLATFRCDYGAGQNIKGGETGIELPGANSLTLMVQEYIRLAENLKARKAALGMKAGIESEIVLDKATTGLYDNAALGKTDGAYASLSRALTDKDSADAAAWAAQNDKTAQKLKTGATVAGVGAAIGIAGNIAVNKANKKTERAEKRAQRDAKLAEERAKKNKKNKPNTTISLPSSQTVQQTTARTQPPQVATPTTNKNGKTNELTAFGDYIIDDAHPLGPITNANPERDDGSLVCECTKTQNITINEQSYRYDATQCQYMYNTKQNSYDCMPISCDYGYSLDEYRDECRDNDLIFDNYIGMECPYDMCEHDTYIVGRADKEGIPFADIADINTCKYTKYLENILCVPQSVKSGYVLHISQYWAEIVGQNESCDIEDCYYAENAATCMWQLDSDDEFSCMPSTCESGYEISYDDDGDPECVPK